MTVTTVEEAQAHLPALIAQLKPGEEVVIVEIEGTDNLNRPERRVRESLEEWLNDALVCLVGQTRLLDALVEELLRRLLGIAA